MIQNPEFVPCRIVRRQFDSWLRAELVWHFETSDESRHLSLCDPAQPLQVLQLRFQLVAGPIKPIPLSRSPMYTQWCAHSIAKFLRTDSVLPWKHLNSFRQSRASLDWQLEPKSEVVDIHAAISGEQWLAREKPKGGGAGGVFQ